MTIYKLDNAIQKYAWGHPKYIAELLGIENNDNTPLAELWMGAHPKAPSAIVNSKINEEDLLKLITNDPKRILGPKVSKRFGKLPFLFKVLAAGSPLSIQAHPNLEQAKTGFARENKNEIDLDAFNRSYKDDNHKPEMMCALTTFKALNGFRPIEEIKLLLHPIQEHIPQNIWRLIEKDDSSSLKDLLTFLMTLEENVKTALLNDLLNVASEHKDFEVAYEWVLKLNATYPNDIGILCPLILNLIELKPGEAVFLEAGRLHSYLEGLGIELMANSDNVLRGGLTPKFIDVDELLSVLKFEVSKINKVTVMGNDIENYYPRFVDEFQLSLIDINANKTYTANLTREPSIFICIDGEGLITTDDTVFEFKKGDTFFVSYETYHLKIAGNAKLFKAATPKEL